MATEIERKFLITDDSWRDSVQRCRQMRQGYLISDEQRSVRVRVTDDGAHLNIKSATVGPSRSEYEYPIPRQDGEELLDRLCKQPLLEKTRHWVPYGDHLWEIDVFEGANQGLIVAEVELTSVDQPFERPDWVGEEVTDDKRYYNSCLAEHPYRDW